MSVPEKKKQEQTVGANVTKVQEIGGLAGRVILAVLVVQIVSRRKLLWIFLLPGLVIIPFVFFHAAVHNLSLLYPGMFFAGLLTVGQFSFWGNYLLRVFPIHLHRIGEGFAANIGGRILDTSFVWVTVTLAATNDTTLTPARLAYTAAGIVAFVYSANFILPFFPPEPAEETLPE
ncbi:MAG: hypothetical protein M2R45_01740 [Verrucomicrobia subdivision 3 bacterium]|nr:hypothetical protein [Limisphaerales bacterium]MCS1413477.1 hypothetical protein [Limisphaerales bacterium]